MDSPPTLPLSLPCYYYQGQSMEELLSSLLCTTQELEITRVAAQEEIRRREEEVHRLKHLLNRAIRERDEAQDKCQKLVLDDLLLQQYQNDQITPLPGIGTSSIEEEELIRGGDSNTGILSSDCEESIVSSPAVDPIRLSLPATLQTLELRDEKALPEKGKFLQAVMKAGPLLQTLLVTGPLPKWRYPPPLLDLSEIPFPPVPIPSPSLLNQAPPIGFNPNKNSFGNKKRSPAEVCEGSDSSTCSKYQRLFLH